MDTRCAVLAVSFGTRFPDAWQTGIAPIERELADALPGFALRRASTGEILRRAIFRRRIFPGCGGAAAGYSGGLHGTFPGPAEFSGAAPAG